MAAACIQNAETHKLHPCCVLMEYFPVDNTVNPIDRLSPELKQDPFWVKRSATEKLYTDFYVGDADPAQPLCSPIKADEAALIDRANLTIRLIEKKVALDDKKDFYLSTKVFACTQAMPEKAKLKAVCETAVAAVQQAYPEPEQLDDVPPFDGGTETAVELLVRNQAVDNTISVEDVRTRMEEQYPLAVPAFEQALADSGVERSDRVTVSPSRIKKLESRSFKTESGIEIKIPAELCNSDDAVEFIHSATGGLSLLIKDVLV